MPDEPELTPYLRRLPIGERLPLGDLATDRLFPFESDTTVKPLEEPVVPEPPRLGEPGGGPCPNCGQLDQWAIWENERWIVRTLTGEPHGLPAVVMLISRAHVDLEAMSATEIRDLGPMIQRITRAVASLPDVERVHVDRRGDSSEHFHLWFLARPTGMVQMRGPLLAIWDDLLPKLPADEWSANLRRIASALAGEDGVALI
jgi:diadenosine tetraphosphate (Ap4A) HIT family hydrolase